MFQINPIWIYGPFDPAEVSAASQPDWYMGWLDGALRIMPGWEIRAFGFEIPNPFFPGGAAGRRHLRRCCTRGRSSRPGSPATTSEHHLLDRPRQRPVRTALGAATFAFYGILLPRRRAPTCCR